MNFSSVHIFRFVNIFPCVCTWLFIRCCYVFSNDEVIHHRVGWPVGIIELSPECKPRGVGIIIEHVSLKESTNSRCGSRG